MNISIRRKGFNGQHKEKLKMRNMHRVHLIIPYANEKIEYFYYPITTSKSHYGYASRGQMLCLF